MAKKKPATQVSERCRSIEVHVGVDALIEWVGKTLKQDLTGYEFDEDVVLERNSDNTISLTFIKHGPAWK